MIMKYIKWACYAAAAVGIVLVLMSFFGPKEVAATDSKASSSSVVTKE